MNNQIKYQTDDSYDDGGSGGVFNYVRVNLWPIENWLIWNQSSVDNVDEMMDDENLEIIIKVMLGKFVSKELFIEESDWLKRWTRTKMYKS